MDIKATIFLLLGIAMAITCIGLLWTFFRLWRSGQKTKGAIDRLRFPDPKGVTPLCQFTPGKDVITFYQSSRVVELHEFQFIDTRAPKPKAWHISNFIPITPIDTQEAINRTGIQGLPIADSGDGGLYYLSPSGTIRLRESTNHLSPCHHQAEDNDLLVAESFATFSRFSPHREADKDLHPHSTASITHSHAYSHGSI